MSMKKDLTLSKSETKSIRIIKKYLDEHGFNYEIYRTPSEVDRDFLNTKTWYIGNPTNCMPYREFIEKHMRVESAKARTRLAKEREMLEDLIENEHQTKK